ncbi:hypothetical protein [Salmonella phage SD-1_S14]|nr:hypothetical protein [Salmonella phage SD-1_S14]
METSMNIRDVDCINISRITGGLHIVHITNSLTRRKRVALFLSIAVLVATVVGLKHPDT